MDLCIIQLVKEKVLDIGGNTDKMFVVGKNLEKNILYVAFGDNEYLYSDSCLIDQVNFNCELRPTKCSAKFRYRQDDNPVKLEYLDNDEILVKYDHVNQLLQDKLVFYI